MLGLVKDVAVRAVKAFSRENCGQKAAAISYYVLLSLFPLVIFAVSFLGIIAPESSLRERVVDAVLQNVPLRGEGENDVSSALRDVSSGQNDAVSVIGLLALFWAASSMFGALRTALNDVFDEPTQAPLLVRKAADLAMVLAFALLFLASLGLTAAMRYAADTEDNVPLIGELARDSSVLLAPFKVFLPMVISFGALFFVYWLVPAGGDRHKRDLAVGAVVAAVLFEVAKHGFTIYLDNFTNYALVFGPLGAIIAFLLWLYLSAAILLLGAAVAVAVAAVREQRSQPELVIVGRGATPAQPTWIRKALFDVHRAFLKRTPRRQRY